MTSLLYALTIFAFASAAVFTAAASLHDSTERTEDQ